MDILTHPLTYVMAGIIGFFAQDVFHRIQKTGDLKTEVEQLKTRVIALEAHRQEHQDMVKCVVRLEEQVKGLSEDIKYLLTLLRVQFGNDKTLSS